MLPSGTLPKAPLERAVKEEQKVLLSTVRGLSLPGAPKPASAWLWMLQALNFTATSALWVEWDKHHSSPQLETGPKEESLQSGKKERNLRQTPGPIPPQLAGTPQKARAVLKLPSWHPGGTPGLHP